MIEPEPPSWFQLGMSLVGIVVIFTTVVAVTWVAVSLLVWLAGSLGNVL